MKRFFLEKVLVQMDINNSDIVAYRKAVAMEMKKMGASDKELVLIHDATIINSIKNKRRPEDVAWAILQ